MPWIQQYDPFSHVGLSTAAATSPVLVLMGLLISGRVRAWQAAWAGLATAWTVAVLGFGMPALTATAAAGYGLVFAIFRIVWLILAAVFLYRITVETGQFAVIKASVARLSGDCRIQAVLVAFSFGALIEGVAGFGAPVAISAALLVGLGFPARRAAVVCLVANTAPVAWGALGIPIQTLADVTGLPIEALSATAGRILPPISLIIPFWLIRILVPGHQARAVWPAPFVIGLTFALTQAIWSNFVGPVLVDIVSSVASLGAGVLLLRSWRPAQTLHFDQDGRIVEDEPQTPAQVADDPTLGPLTTPRVLRAWMPIALLTLLVMIWGLPAIEPLGLPKMQSWLNQHTSWTPGMPGLEGAVLKGSLDGQAQVVDPSRTESARLPLVPVSATGTAVFLAAVFSGFLLGLGPRALAQIFLKTAGSLVPAAAAIFGMLALGFVTKYAGLDTVMGLALTRVGPELYPIFGTLLGWLGVALTGSDTSSNVLFGNLQAITARELGLNPILMASANSTGGVMGKMIDAQSIVVATAATGSRNQEASILRAVLVHSVVLVLMVAAIVWIYAKLLPNAIPIVE